MVAKIWPLAHFPVYGLGQSRFEPLSPPVENADNINLKKGVKRQPLGSWEDYLFRILAWFHGQEHFCGPRQVASWGVWVLFSMVESIGFPGNPRCWPQHKPLFPFPLVSGVPSWVGSTAESTLCLGGRMFLESRVLFEFHKTNMRASPVVKHRSMSADKWRNVWRKKRLWSVPSVRV